MLDILRDSIWQFIGAIFALIAVILVWVRRQHKALSYKIISNTPLVKIKEEVKGKLRVFFDEKPVENIYLIIIKFINSGNLPIKSVDYESPVYLKFGEDVQVLTAEVTETNPDDLGASVKIEGTKVLLMPTLLNGNDSITIKVLVNQFGGQITVGGRVIGVKKIQELTERKFLNFSNGVIVGLVSTMITGIGISLAVQYPANLKYFIILFLILIFLISLVIMIITSRLK